MKKLLLAFCLLISFNLNSQVISNDTILENKLVKKYKTKNFFKELYKDFLKYGTFYVAGDAANAYEQTYKDYFVERPADGDLYSIPRVIDVTNYYPMDYRVGLGFRKFRMIIKIKYDKSTKQIVVSNDIQEIVLSVVDSTIIDTNDELSFEVAADMSAYQDLFERDIEEEIE